jgi:hypothetical protein
MEVKKRQHRYQMIETAFLTDYSRCGTNLKRCPEEIGQWQKILYEITDGRKGFLPIVRTIKP